MAGLQDKQSTNISMCASEKRLDGGMYTASRSSSAAVRAHLKALLAAWLAGSWLAAARCKGLQHPKIDMEVSSETLSL
jgi:hypothetical protein